MPAGPMPAPLPRPCHRRASPGRNSTSVRKTLELDYRKLVGSAIFLSEILHTRVPLTHMISAKTKVPDYFWDINTWR